MRRSTFPQGKPVCGWTTLRTKGHMQTTSNRVNGEIVKLDFDRPVTVYPSAWVIDDGLDIVTIGFENGPSDFRIVNCTRSAFDEIKRGSF